MGDLLLEMLAISLAKLPKFVFAHSEVLEILFVFPVQVNPSHASPQEAHIFLPESLFSWSCPKPSRRPQETNQLLERWKKQERRRKQCRQCYAALAPMAIQNISSTLRCILHSRKTAQGCKIERK